jgi:mannose/cellobiose epimerase-like protein (N-acyl-D-glucosamine 2-epimerase family)
MLDASARLFHKGVDEGWDVEAGGLVYTVDFDGRPLNRDRYWWPIAEAIVAAAYLGEETGDPYYERWYREFWDFADAHLIDHERGGWQHVLDPYNRPSFSPYPGKVDLFHALHACLLPLLPKDEMPTAALAGRRFDG